MSQIVSAALTVAAIALLRNPLKRYPGLFYVLACLMSGAAAYLTYHPLPSQALRTVVFTVQKGYVGFAVLAVVMFIGVMGEGSRVRRALQPVRAELSIVGGILAAAHVVPFAGSYIRSLASLGSLRLSVQVSLAVAVVLTALLVVLVVTSFRVVKKRMDAATWKRVQTLAYPFFLLIYIHVLGYLMVPVMGGSADAAVALGFYTVLFAAYVTLRLRRSKLDAAKACQ